MKIDEKGLNELIVESQDLQRDALHDMRGSLEELEYIREDRRTQEVDPSVAASFNAGRRDLMKKIGLGAGGVVGGGYLAALTGIVGRPVYAADNMDVQILQTASSLEILAVATYAKALTLPFIGTIATVKKFAELTMMQHDEHRKSFQAQTTALGGKVQSNPNPKYKAVVDGAVPGLTGADKVVDLAIALETVATETYLADLALLKDSKLRSVMAGVMGVESQHLATLRAVGALLGKPELIVVPFPPNLIAKLPAAAGSVAFPAPFEPTEKASPPSEGAVQ